MAPLHRTGDGSRIAAPDWESLADRQIREAQERGDWDTSAWVGRRLPAQDGAYERPEAGANAILRNAGGVPEWIDLDRECRRLDEERGRLLALATGRARGGRAATRARYAAVLAALADALRRLEVAAPTPAQQRPLIDPAVELAEFDRRTGRP